MKRTFRDLIKQIASSPSLKWAALLFVLALIPRLLWAIADHPRPFSDMEDYYLCAVNFLKGGYLAQSPDRLAYRAPMYPLFLALCLRTLPGEPLLTLRLVQSVVGSISTVLLFLTARRLLQPFLDAPNLSRLSKYRDLLSFLIGLFYALMAYPIFFCSVFMTETLFIALFLAWILWSLHLHRKSPLWSFAGFSLLLGVLALIRPIALFFVPVLIGVVLFQTPKEKWTRTAWLPLTAWLLPILPWTARNILVFHAFVFISTNSGVNLFIGNNPTFGYYESGYKETIRREFIKRNGPDEVGEDRLFQRKGFEQIAYDPSTALKRGWWKFYFLYMLDKEPWPWEEYNQGGGLRFAGGAAWPTVRWRPWFLALAALGIAYAFVKRLKHVPLLGAVAFYTLACLIFFARTRFRMPLEPLLTVYMGLGVLSLVELTVWGYRYRIHSKGKNDS